MQLWSKEPKNEFQIDHAVYELLLRDYHVVGAGLDRVFNGELFGRMGELISLANYPLKKIAGCQYGNGDGKICGEPAHWTQRLVNEKPAHYLSPVIVIGGTANVIYQSRCSKHHEVPGSPRNYSNNLINSKQQKFDFVEEYLVKTHDELIAESKQKIPNLNFDTPKYGCLEDRMIRVS